MYYTYTEIRSIMAQQTARVDKSIRNLLYTVIKNEEKEYNVISEH